MKKKSPLKPIKNSEFISKKDNVDVFNIIKSVDNFPHINDNNTPDFIKDGGECGEIIRSIDWSNTSLGPIKFWPNSLKNCLRIMLTSPQPIWIGWGDELMNLYNDPCKSIIGNQHPGAIGKPISVVHKEIWEKIGPYIHNVINENKVIYIQSELFIVNRYGYKEEVYFTFAFRPISGENGKVDGFICSTTDETKRIIEERQLRTLKDLGKNLIDVKTEAETFTKTIKVLEENLHDFPLAFFCKANKNDITLEFNTNPVVEQTLIENLSFKQLLKASKITLTDIPNDWPKIFVEPWKVNITKILVIPISLQTDRKPYGFLVVGLNPYVLYNEKYESFFRVIQNQIAATINNVKAFEEERKRAEALKEINHLKTNFFSNISHELRTPLTLILGPIESILNEHNHNLTSEVKHNIELTHRNALRLLKLVNSLLDFSRIEAGKENPKFQPIDLASFTFNLAKTFKPLIEKAGLEFDVQCDILSERVYVDKEMWEKIVLNLISNAFKYTHKGKISVFLTEEHNKVIFKVKDTGIGISQNNIPKIFERFHRIENAKGRTYEGTGIGLSLVQDLVKFHNGEVTVDSQEGIGSTFTITLLFGNQHLLKEHIVDEEKDILPSSLSDVFITEANLLTNDTNNSEVLSFVTAEKNNTNKANNPNNIKKASILLVDDNIDMLAYLKQFLENQFIVITAINGKDALEKINIQIPDLIISDIMMPEMDGNTLLKIIKSDPQQKHIPVILLSARTGEEAKLQSYEAGADDYLVKPFSSKELLSRIHSQLKIAKTRYAAEKHLHNIFMQAPVAIASYMGPSFIIDFANDKALEIWGRQRHELIGKSLFEAFPDTVGSEIEKIHRRVYETGQGAVFSEQIGKFYRHGKLFKGYFNTAFEPLRDLDGNVIGMMVIAQEVTDAVNARKKIEANENRLRIAIDLAQMGMWDYDPITEKVECSKRTREIFGFEEDAPLTFQNILTTIVEEDREMVLNAIQEAFKYGSDGNYDIEYSLINHIDKKQKTVRSKGKAFFNAVGKVYLFTGTVLDITEQKNTINALRLSEERFRIMANTAPVMMWMSGEDKYGDFFNISWLKFTGRTLEQEIKNGWLEGVYPDDVSKCIDTYKKAFASQEPFNIEYRLKRYDGQYRWVSDHAAPRYDTTGAFIGYVGACIDIDDQKLFSEKLQQSELLFKTIANASPIGLWMTDPNGMNTFVNNTLVEWSGIPAEELLGFGWTRCIADEYKSLITDPDKILKYIINRERYSMEYQSIAHNGELRWVFSEGIPFYNINGEFGGYSGYIVDITEKKQIQEELERKVDERTAELKRSEEQHYKMINEVSDYAIILLDKDGNIKNWNKGAEKIKGYKDYEIIGKNFKIFYPSSVYHEQIVNDLILEASKNGRAAIEGWKIKKDQTLFWASTTITALHDETGNIIGFSNVTRDLTEKKIAEQKLEAHAMELGLKNNELRQQKEFVDAIIDSSVDIVCVLDKELNYLSFNKVAENIYGKHKDEVIGKKVIEVFPDIGHTNDYKNLLQVLENGEPYDSIHQSTISGRYYHTFYIPLKHKEEIYAILTIGHDNTEIIEASKKLEEAYAILKEKSNDLEKVNAELEKSNNELEQFAYVASHDLQEPLRKIQFFIERLEKILHDIDPSAKFFFDKIKNSARRMNTLIKDLLDFSRLSQGNTSFVKTNLNFILNSVKTDFELLIQQKNATIKIDKLPIIEAIPLQMQQLFFNIINNALKFSKADLPPAINISCKKLSIDDLSTNHPQLNKKTDYYQISIKDNGIGFDQQYAEKIFIIFQRLNDLYTYGGTGIGLALCKKIVINHHGDIYATGEEDKGATFHIILPEKQV